NATFPEYLKNSNGFLTDLTNYATDGTLPTSPWISQQYRDLVSTWGSLLFSAGDASYYNFSPNTTITFTLTKVLNQSDNIIRKITYNVPVDNPNPATKDALQKMDEYKKSHATVETDQE